MTMRDSIISSFRGLLLAKAFEKITVVVICRQANVTRTAFYTYFKDKDDLLECVIEEDLVEPVRQMCRALPADRIKSAPQLITMQSYLGVLEDKELYRQINKIENGSRLVRVLTKKYEQISAEILRDFKMSETEKDYLAYFAASSHGMLTSRWIEREFDVSPELLARYYRKWIMGYWEAMRSHKPDWSPSLA
jgi:AcrR family transcriptional regulator